MKMDNYFMTSLLPLWMFHDQMYIVNFGHYHANKFHIFNISLFAGTTTLRTWTYTFEPFLYRFFLIIKSIIYLGFLGIILGMLQHTRKDVITHYIDVHILCSKILNFNWGHVNIESYFIMHRYNLSFSTVAPC